MENRLIVRYHLIVLKREGRSNKGDALRWSCSVEASQLARARQDPEPAGQPKGKIARGRDQKNLRGAAW